MKKSDSDAPKKHGGGPKTPEGKGRSAMNALRHGFTAEVIVLPTESNDYFQDLLADYVHGFAPDNRIELDLIHELVATRWRMQRAWNMEQAALESGMRQVRAAVIAEFGNATPDVLTTKAFAETSANNHDLQLINRYEVRLTRRFHQILGEIKSLRKDGLIRNTEPLPDRPRPAETSQITSPAPVATTICETNSVAAPVTPKCETNSAPRTETPAPRKCETNSAPPRAAPPAGKPGPAAPAAQTPQPAPRPAPPDCETNSPAHKRYRCTLLDPKTGQRVEVTPEEWQAHIDRILARQHRREGDE